MRPARTASPYVFSHRSDRKLGYRQVPVQIFWPVSKIRLEIQEYNFRSPEKCSIYPTKFLCAFLNIHELPQQTRVNFYYLDFLFIKLGTTQARILTVFLNERQRRKLLGGSGGMHPPKIFSSTPRLVPSRYLFVSGVREDWGLF